MNDMSVRHLLFAGAFALPTLLTAGGRDASTNPPGRELALSPAAPIADFAVRPPVPWAREDPADSLYREARELLNRGDNRRAAELFGQIASQYPRSAYAADALYWRAFALYRSGGEPELRDALQSLASQRSRYPKAPTTADAKALEVRIQGALARQGDAPAAAAVSKGAAQPTTCATGDDDGDVRTAALNALMQMDSDRALPIIKRLLERRDECSEPLRRKAVFLLSQKQTSETESLMLAVVQRDPSQRVREEAVFWMGQLRSERAAAALEDIALRSPDERLREKAVFALGQQNLERGQAVVRRIADSDDVPRRVRDQAIFQLGQRSSNENAQFLRGLFARLGRADGSESVRKHVLFSLSQMKGAGNDRWLLGVAADASQSVEMRKHALWTAGQAGVPASEFIPMYDRTTERPLREHLIWVLSQSNERTAADKLIDIARSDRDPEMRKKAIFWLGQMHDPRIQQLLLDIIDKG
jgi:HEAT repeat protein